MKRWVVIYKDSVYLLCYADTQSEAFRKFENQGLVVDFFDIHEEEY